jgi:hypothetical protein
MSCTNVTYNRKWNAAYTVFVFSPKATNRVLSNLHFTNSVIVMSPTDGILLVIRYSLDYVTADLADTVSVQKALAQL